MPTDEVFTFKNFIMLVLLMSQMEIVATFGSSGHSKRLEDGDGNDEAGARSVI